MFLSDQRLELSMRKHCTDFFRSLGVRKMEEYEPHKVTWGDLNKHSAEVKRQARALIDKIKDAKEDELNGLEAAHDAQMEIFDAIENEKDIRTDLGSRSPRADGGNPNRPNPGEGEARASDHGEFMTPGEDAPTSLRANQSVAAWMQRGNRNGDESRGISLGAYMRAMIMGPKNDI